MEKKMIIPKDMYQLHDNWHFSPGIVVEDTLYIGGTIGMRSDGSIPRNPEDQFVLCFENMKAVLEEAGATFDNLVDLTSFHTDLQHNLAVFSEVKDRYVNDPFPGWTAIGVRELANRDLVVEIKGIACL
ncbi:MAG: RidA family protein [Proteobacteria bacterium]|nr:RidA family protein [Pseudomonadota bacterium]